MSAEQRGPSSSSASPRLSGWLGSRKSHPDPRPDIDVFEIAEAFGALCLRFRRDLDAGPERMNPNGGTMAIGHAFGATGAILVGSCIEGLEQRDGRYGVAAVSGAAGLGVAILVERISA